MNLAPVLASLYGWPLLILALGIYSITRLVTKDTIVDRQREWFFNKFPHDGFTTKRRPNPKRCEFIVTGDHYYVTKGHWLGELVSCPWCSGFWVSLSACAAFYAWPVATIAVLVPLGLRVIPGLVVAWVEKN